jgi:hypothetical protein
MLSDEEACVARAETAAPWGETGSSGPAHASDATMNRGLIIQAFSVDAVVRRLQRLK